MTQTAESYFDLYRAFDPPYSEFNSAMLGPEFPRELEVVSRLWFKCGYWPGIASYLNFFLLKDFIVTHDQSYPPRFQSFRSMGDSFYKTDIFIRDVTDTALKPTGGISNPEVQKTLKQIMRRHERVSIPSWMMTYFGFSLFEMVEKFTGPLSAEEQRLHIAYMSKTYRIMGIAFTENREAIVRFAREVESVHAGKSPNLERHARNILILGEMANVSSRYEKLSPLLPEKTRALFREIYPSVRLSPLLKALARIAGRLLLKQAVGKPRKAVPFDDL